MEEKSPEIASTYPEGSFKRLFWEEQFRAASKKDSHQVRWHPLIMPYELLGLSLYRPKGHYVIIQIILSVKQVFNWNLTSNLKRKLKSMKLVN